MVFILKNFAAIKPYLPPNLQPFSRGFGFGDGWSTHPELVSRDWLRGWGDRVFLRFGIEIPDAFFTIATRNTGGAEYLVVMWKRNGRLFYFHRQYVNFCSGDPVWNDKHEDVRVRLAEALERWERGEPSVVVTMRDWVVRDG